VYRRTEHLCSFSRSWREHHAIRWAIHQPSDWRALTLGVGTALMQRVVMEQPRPFDVDVAEAHAELPKFDALLSDVTY
jgi:hypothetical protein